MERRPDRSEQKYLNTFIIPMEKSQKGRKGRRAAHVEYASPSGFSSQQSRIPSCGPFLKQYMKKMHQQRNLRQAKQNIKDFHGKHNILMYKPEFNFTERWETVGIQSDIDKKYLSLNNDNGKINAAQLALAIGYGLALWFLSAYRVFKMETLSYYLATVTLLTQIGDVIVAQIATPREDKGEPVKIKELLRRHAISAVFMLYLFFLFVEQVSIGSRPLPFIFVDIFFLVKVYKRFKKLFLKVKIKIPSSWRNQVEIFQLIGGCLTLVHFFSILLCLAAESDASNNWGMDIAQMRKGWFQKYLFSLYFTCTTMFTVGYGDITPKNNLEIITILIVQVVGIINIGYVINEVGRFLSKINESEDQLFRSISNAQKLSQSYNLPEQLSRKVTSYLVNNQIASSKFNVEEEDVFLKKLSDEVRQDVTRYHSFELVKTSVFFLCHWTKRFQRTVADKLIRQVYSPEELLPQAHGREKIYLLSRGKIEIQANFTDRQRPLCEKKLVVLEVSPEKDVHFNVYGYSQLISGQKVNLRAIARDYSICYCLDKPSLLAAIEESQTDFEYFHQIRSKIQQSKCKEAFQAPCIKSTKEHYLPHPYFIVKRQGRKKARKQRRESCLTRKMKKLFVLLTEEDEKKLIELRTFRERTMTIETRRKTTLDEEFFLKPSDSSSLKLKSQTEIEQGQKKRRFMENLDGKCEYSYFRKKFNAKAIFSKYNRQFHEKQTEKKEIQNILTKSSPAFKQVSERVQLKLLNAHLST